MIDYISTLSRRLTSQFSLVLHKLMSYIWIYLNEYHIKMLSRRRNRITVISEPRLDKSGGTIPPSGWEMQESIDLFFSLLQYFCDWALCTYDVVDQSRLSNISQLLGKERARNTTLRACLVQIPHPHSSSQAAHQAPEPKSFGCEGCQPVEMTISQAAPIENQSHIEI
jgi:hypothetical protein